MKNLEKLYDLVGESCLYKGDHIVIKGVIASDADELVRIKTSVGDIPLSPMSIDLFLRQCLPSGTDRDESAVVVARKSGEQVDKLKTILLRSMEKLQTDKEFINQAKAINNHVNTLLNMVKLEIQLKKMSNEI